MTPNIRLLVSIGARSAAWAWALVAGVGGLSLLIDQGPWPITNGWFALFSGVVACPLTASAVKRHTRITVPGYVQFALALLIMIAVRVAVVVLLHRPFLPECSASCW